MTQECKEKAAKIAKYYGYGKKADRVFFDEFDRPCIITTGRGQSKTIIPFLSLRSAYSAEKIKNWRSVFTTNTMKGFTK